MPRQETASFDFTEGPDGLIYRETGDTRFLRVAAAAAGLIAWMASFIFIVIMRDIDWQTASDFTAGAAANSSRLGSLAASVVGMLAFWAFGAYCLKIALFIPRQTVHFDRSHSLLTLQLRAPAVNKTISYPLSEIRNLQIETQVDEDQVTTFSIAISLADMQRINLGVFNDQQAAQMRLLQIRQLLEISPHLTFGPV